MQQEIERYRARAERAEEMLATLHGEAGDTPWSYDGDRSDALPSCPYNQLLEQLNAIVLFVDSAGLIRYANSFATTLFGLKREEMPGTPVQSILSSCNGAGDDSGDEAGRSLSDYFCDECEIMREDGKPLCVSWSTREIFDGNGEPQGIVAVGTDITREKTTQERLADDQASLRSLASHIAVAEERERRKIAGRIHDEISQNLAYAKLRISALTVCSHGGKCQPIIGEVQQLLDRAIDGTRSLAFELSPPMLYELGFTEAVEWLVEETDEQAGIRCKFSDDGLEKPLEHEASVTLFRAVRELLINAVRHSNAENAEVSLSNDNGRIEIRVEDDGEGFDPTAVLDNGEIEDGVGLINVRERIEHLGGEMEISSNGGGGTRVTLSVPVRQRQSS